MTTMTHIIRTTVLAGAFLAIGTTSGSASPARPDKGTGCYVGDANGDYLFDATCSAHSVIKYDADGKVVFYEYQDAGQLQPGAVRPSRAIRRSFELCLDFGGITGELCGTATEVITPSGQYKSSFDIR